MAPTDLLDPDLVRAAVAGAHTIYHLAYGKEGDGARITIEGTKNLVEAGIQAGADCIVILSTMYVYGFPSGGAPDDESFPYRPYGAEYGPSKSRMERWCLERAKTSGKTRIVVLNPTCVFGPGGGAYTALPVDLARKGQFSFVSGGAGLCNYTYVENVVDAILLAGATPVAHGERFIISDGHMTWRQFLTPLLAPLLAPLAASSGRAIPDYTPEQLASLPRFGPPFRMRDVFRAIVAAGEVRRRRQAQRLGAPPLCFAPGRQRAAPQLRAADGAFAVPWKMTPHRLSRPNGWPNCTIRRRPCFPRKRPATCSNGRLPSLMMRRWTLPCAGLKKPAITAMRRVAETPATAADGWSARLGRKDENSFDVLRLVLAGLVLFEHSFFLTSNSYDGEPLFRLTGGQFNSGSFAVCLFFAISGFLVTRSYVLTAGLGRYLAKRIARIFPGFLVATAIGCLLGWLVADHPQLYFFQQKWPLLALEAVTLHQIVLSGILSANPVHLIHGTLWTIQYEFDCYVLVALLGWLGLLTPRRAWMPYLAIFAGAGLGPGGKSSGCPLSTMA